jgi:HD-GYP domain-containing protein (c-di-GMP phosphodiesterase class II)
MNAPGIEALRTLIAAYEMRRLYGGAHAGFLERARHCAQTCAEAMADEGMLSIVIAADSVVINQDAVDDDWASDAILIRNLRGRGVEAIRITRGVDPDEITWLLECYRSSDAMISPGGHIVLGRVRGVGGCAGDDGGDIVAVDSRQARGNVRSLWTSVLAGHKDSQRLAGLVNRILSATIANRAGLIKLADLKNHDEYTFVHVTNVAILASALGESVGMTGDGLRELTEAALLHDIGKWMLPKRILTKAGQLTDEERLAVQLHPITGAKILSSSPGISNVSIVAAFEHHQRIDGRGYPSTLRGRPPSLLSQIVQVADIFDALRSDRPYRGGLPATECLAIMGRDAGRSFDSALFDAFTQSVVMRLGAARHAGNDASTERKAA